VSYPFIASLLLVSTEKIVCSREQLIAPEHDGNELPHYEPKRYVYVENLLPNFQK